MQRDYLGAIETLNKYQTARPNHESNQPKFNKLEAMTRYLNRCKITPDKLDELPVIHVTGTHGKGTTCFYCERILLGHGCKVGFYSSPHLLEVRERIRIDGKPISKSVFSEHFWEIYDMLDSEKLHEDDMPLYFPFLTILAFHIFLKSKIDVAIVEVGIGGEFDCTNVLKKPVAVGITPISVDHTAILGATEESIAWHKGGIMKPGSMAFSVRQQENILNVLQERSKERNCPLKVLRKCVYTPNVKSKVSAQVKATAATLAIVLSEACISRRLLNDHANAFSMELAIRSVENSCWPGRYDTRNIDNLQFFLDSAHTQGSIRIAAEWYREETENTSALKILIFNLTGKRDPEIFLKELLMCNFHTVIFIPNVGYEKETADTANYKLTPDDQLALCEEYKSKWIQLQGCSGKGSGNVIVLSCFAAALRLLRCGGKADVLVTGSLYLVGAALTVLDPTLGDALVD